MKNPPKRNPVDKPNLRMLLGRCVMSGRENARHAVRVAFRSCLCVLLQFDILSMHKKATQRGIDFAFLPVVFVVFTHRYCCWYALCTPFTSVLSF
jgi:hypothetical protein